MRDLTVCSAYFCLSMQSIPPPACGYNPPPTQGGGGKESKVCFPKTLECRGSLSQVSKHSNCFRGVRRSLLAKGTHDKESQKLLRNMFPLKIQTCQEKSAVFSLH